MPDNSTFAWIVVCSQPLNLSSVADNVLQLIEAPNDPFGRFYLFWDGQMEQADINTGILKKVPFGTLQPSNLFSFDGGKLTCVPNFDFVKVAPVNPSVPVLGFFYGCGEI